MENNFEYLMGLVERGYITKKLFGEFNHVVFTVENRNIPESYPSEVLAKFEFRNSLIPTIGFSLVCKEWIEPLAKWIGDRKCLEVMSGCGIISHALQKEGINIKATDNFSWGNDTAREYDSWNSRKTYWTDIENKDAIEAVKEYGKDIDIVIMSWAYMDDTAYRVLQAMRETNPECLMIFIGEGCGGCTADDTFYESIQEIEDDEFDKINELYPQWWGIHDTLWLVK